LDGIQPTKGILISAYHPESVINLVNYVNQMCDLKGNNYKIETKIWRDESVPYLYSSTFILSLLSRLVSRTLFTSVWYLLFLDIK